MTCTIQSMYCSDVVGVGLDGRQARQIGSARQKTVRSPSRRSKSVPQISTCTEYVPNHILYCGTPYNTLAARNNYPCATTTYVHVLYGRSRQQIRTRTLSPICSSWFWWRLRLFVTQLFPFVSPIPKCPTALDDTKKGLTMFTYHSPQHGTKNAQIKRLRHCHPHPICSQEYSPAQKNPPAHHLQKHPPDDLTIVIDIASNDYFHILFSRRRWAEDKNLQVT